uniref:Uncharacterized protein n=1 Tax=Romanomermis culicivorax TaxID=13658 RepID=A0A915HVD4_ROMCU
MQCGAMLTRSRCKLAVIVVQQLKVDANCELLYFALRTSTISTQSKISEPAGAGANVITYDAKKRKFNPNVPLAGLCRLKYNSKHESNGVDWLQPAKYSSGFMVSVDSILTTHRLKKLKKAALFEINTEHPEQDDSRMSLSKERKWNS